MNSKIRVFKNIGLIADYELSCDVRESLTSLTNNEEQLDDQLNRADIVIPATHPEGLLIACCRQGAHSMRLPIFDFSSRRKEAMWSKVGSYFANWQLNENHELWLNYDEPCDEKNCEDRFRTINLQWPIKQ